MSSTTIAIDPGINGAVVWGTGLHDVAFAVMPDTPADIRDLFRDILVDGIDPVCHMELVGGFAGNTSGTAHSGFQFGNNNGVLLGILAALEIPVVRHRPQAWQKLLGLSSSKHLSKSQHKAKLKARAQELFPGIKVTLKNADALLIYHLACQKVLQNF